LIKNFLLFLLVYLIYLIIPNFIAWLLSKKDKKIKDIKAFIYIVIGSFFAYILHGFSAYYSILCSCYSLLTNKKIEKYKTEIIRD
jgi:cytochrome bd-type quinol oxidase subunit 2